MTERSLFLAVLEIDDPDRRAAYLAGVCQEDSLRERVEQLLKTHESLKDFMDRPAAALIGEDERGGIQEAVGQLIGDYELLERIGEGAFGIVFLAEQKTIRRRVALKILKAGMDTRQVVARFESERQALALMDHPRIARIFDGGETASGRPYFVMELVEGVAITTYCEQNRLTLRQRLALFVEVCEAVEHAHQKGIIHRDLKPNNILVGRLDGAPQVKVIDFGVSKATGPRLSDTWMTLAPHLIGTPLYMSPEQAGIGAPDVDTRADIYSLGVLLYELLTGTTPFKKARMKDVDYDEMRRILREEEPPRPSARMKEIASDHASSNDARESARNLARRCLGELDWIVMKAIDKDRERRYDSAGALAMDVNRYLCDEPVLACPASRWYRLSKLARRNKALFAMSAAISIGVLFAAAALAVSNVLIRNEQSRTQTEKDRAEKALRLAEVRADQIRDGLDRLKMADKLLDRGRWYAREMRWDDAHAALTRAASLRPDYSSVWAELGQLHAVLGLWDLAASDFARELESAKPDTISHYHQNGLLSLTLGDTVRHKEIARNTRARFRGTINRDFIAAMVRTSAVGPEPIENSAELVAMAEQVLPRDWFALYILGLAHHRAGRHDRAVSYLNESLQAGLSGTSVPLALPVLATANHHLARIFHPIS